MKKKPPRERRDKSVESLQEREAKKTKPEKPKPKIIRLRDPNAPQRLVSRDTIYYKFLESYKNLPLKKLGFTFILILLGGVGSAVFGARNANIQTEINRASNELRTIHAENFAAESQLSERYTFFEIERIASERLGMSVPEPSQIITISVPRVGGVTLNTDDHVLPQHNYFWDDVKNFVSGIFNQIFGG